jgi:maleate cis-trans isomerase
MVSIKQIGLDEAHRVKVICNVSHSNDKTTLEQDLTLIIQGSPYIERKVTASMSLQDLEVATTKEALLKMAEWCERMAESLREGAENNISEIPI